MKIAFISDIHANFPALCAALASAERHGATAIYCAGDTIGVGPHPREVIRLLQERNIPTVVGNIERKVLDLVHNPKTLKKKKSGKGKKANLAWTAQQLDTTEVAWLDNLPVDISSVLQGVRISIVHGSPLSDSDYIYPSITPEALRSKLRNTDLDILVCGHSHIPFTKKAGGIRILNCGSVGKPIDGDPRGSYGLVTISSAKSLRARIVRFSYNIENLLHDIADRKVPGAGPEEFKMGCKERKD